MTVVSGEVRAGARAASITDFLASRYAFWIVLVLYLAAHVLLRLWETPNIGKNDVQEAVAAQSWAWGYHPRNPPLHTWLLMASYSVFGVTVLAHAVLKYLLLGATYVFAYLSARRSLSTPLLATLCALSLALVSPFAWTVHTALTHTLLLAALIFATLWTTLRLTQERRATDYVLFGAMLGLGFLAKYSYPLFLLPLLAAMLSQHALRRALLDWRILISLGVGAVLFLPHGLWMLTGRFDFVEFLVTKQRSAADHLYLTDVALGAGNLVVAALSFLAPLVFIFPLIFAGARKQAAAPMSPWMRAVALTPVFGIGLLLLDVFVLRATQFEQRYLMCALGVAPLAMFQWLDRRPLSQASVRRFMIAIAVGSLIVLTGLAGRAAFYNRSCDRCVDEMPTGALVAQVRAAGFSGGTIIADHYNVAGNMRLAFPTARVYAANYFVTQPADRATGQCLLVWNARNAGDPLPPDLADHLARLDFPQPQDRPHYVEALLLRNAERRDRLAYWLVPNADGDCRPR